MKDIKSESSQDSDFKIDLDDLKFAFERVPQEEPWFEAFRRQDTGEVIYISSGSDHGELVTLNVINCHFLL